MTAVGLHSTEAATKSTSGGEHPTAGSTAGTPSGDEHPTSGGEHPTAGSTQGEHPTACHVKRWLNIRPEQS